MIVTTKPSRDLRFPPFEYREGWGSRFIDEVKAPQLESIASVVANFGAVAPSLMAVNQAAVIPARVIPAWVIPAWVIPAPMIRARVGRRLEAMEDSVLVYASSRAGDDRRR